jgi:hypothetical protein
MNYRIVPEIVCGNCKFLQVCQIKLKTYRCGHPDIKYIAKVKLDWPGCEDFENDIQNLFN